MIRVGFIIVAADQGWLGGMSYFRNLFRALFALPERELAPVIVTGTECTVESITGEFPQIEIVRTALLDRGKMGWAARKAVQIMSGRDVLLDRFLRANNIAVISHFGHLGRGARVRVVGWIPDFQHKYLPAMFPPKERRLRDRSYEKQARYSSSIILSSAAAASDFARWFPQFAAKSRVLRFTADPMLESASPGDPALRSRYGLTEPYFHLPNQFWVHKNHRVVIDALAILKARGLRFTVLATGNTDDHRHPGYLRTLLDHAKHCGVADEFRVLGVVPYADLVWLMSGALAVINPSRCEGWSTTVEEAKSLGKQVILSDIAVHREQMPEAGRYFDPDDAAQLARLLQECVRDFDPEQDRARAARARASFPQRRAAFAKTYQSIILDAVRSPG